MAPNAHMAPEPSVAFGLIVDHASSAVAAPSPAPDDRQPYAIRRQADAGRHYYLLVSRRRPRCR